MKKTDPAALRDFANQLALMKHKAGELGLLKTMHAMEPATQAIGWEIAEMLDKERKEDA